MELIIEKMFKNFVVEPERSGDDRKVAYFKLTYRDRSPEAARNFAAELASKYSTHRFSHQPKRRKQPAKFQPPIIR